MSNYEIDSSMFFNGLCNVSPEKEVAIRNYIANTNNTKMIVFRINVD
jgi:hypothetical protein